MATVVLSAAGAAVGGAIGGTFAGLGSAVIGRAVGATIGRVIDQRLLGQGSEVVEQGRVDRFRLTNASEGEPIAQVFGRMRVGGQVIWASDFIETSTVTGGGKGRPQQPQTREYAYRVSLALALCAGEILDVGRVWADGEEVSRDDLNMRVYRGDKGQLPDPTMEAIEGTGAVPAYRGTAYVVFEDLALEPFGNRVPQFSFEVLRAEPGDEPGADEELARGLRGVALMPGTGEYALATTPVTLRDGQTRRSANVNTPSGKADLLTSLDALTGAAPGCEAVSLVVSWFGDDLRCGACDLRPKVERRAADGENMPWHVAGVTRATAEEIAQVDGRVVYGGTPSDLSVIEAIRAIRDAGQEVMFYPFILMDQLEGNGLPDPYSDAEDQPVLPWRGRITLSKAPGQPGSPDGTTTAAAEVDAFFGQARAADFTISGETVSYAGPQEWRLARFILHYAALCKAAGGVEAFCISSEMRGLTQIRAGGGAFHAVERLRALAAEVRAILGPETKISYAADWSEYFGYQPQDGSGDRYFHLDPLWADDNIDFIGIDNYMPLSDWRDGTDHADAVWGDIYDLDYLRANIAGGEGYDWFYHSDQARDAQIRTAITDGDHGEPWVWRYKDIRNWWENAHHERIGGARQAYATAWVPQSKPIWFTEYGCAAVDKGTNQPNKFVDPKSSESSLPHYSTGGRDDLIQKHYYRAMHGYWRDPAHNPVSEVYEGAMVNMDRAFAWAWDARPFPMFPNNADLWSDGVNYPRGHWLNGRLAGRSLASVVAELCERSGLAHYDVSALFGYVRGFVQAEVSDARAALQVLMLRYAFDAIEREGMLVFRMRNGRDATVLDPALLAEHTDIDGTVEQTRAGEVELAGRVRLRFVEADGDFANVAEETVLPDDATHAVSTSELPLALTRSEGRQVLERWLSEARLARDTARFALPLSRVDLGAGDVVRLPAVAVSEGEDALYRIDRIERGEMQLVDAVRIDAGIYQPILLEDRLAPARAFAAPVPLTAHFMDLPLLTGDEVPHAPSLAISGTPWPGSAAVYQSAGEDAFVLKKVVSENATIGVTETPLLPACAGVFDWGPGFEVTLPVGALSSASAGQVLSGANVAAIGDGTPNGWEVIQYAEAQLIAPGRYLLRGLLRGQLGTEFLHRATLPAGARFVLLNGAVGQLDLPSNLRRVAQTYRIGPAQRAFDDPVYVSQTHAFDGNGLRPYAPVHLRLSQGAAGVQAQWIRRTRIDGDSWEVTDVPLGEEREAYLVRVLSGATVLREEESPTPDWFYPNAGISADGASGVVEIAVAQISARFGPGPFARASIVL